MISFIMVSKSDPFAARGNDRSVPNRALRPVPAPLETALTTSICLTRHFCRNTDMTRVNTCGRRKFGVELLPLPWITRSVRYQVCSHQLETLHSCLTGWQTVTSEPLLHLFPSSIRSFAD